MAMIDMMNDAQLFVTDEEQLTRIMNLPLQISVGTNERCSHWKTLEEQFGHFLASTLSKHVVGSKDGVCFMGGYTPTHERKQACVEHMDLCVLDIDNGHSMEEAKIALQETGLFGVIYTTHSHGRDYTDLKVDELVDWCRKHGSPDPDRPTVEDVRNYLEKQKNYVPALLDSIKSAERSSGMFHVVHDPIVKFRIVMPLKERFIFDIGEGKISDRVTLWKGLYTAHCINLDLGASFDRSTRDITRLFFTPRHDKGKEDWAIWIVGGDPLNLTSLPPVGEQELRELGLDDQERVMLEHKSSKPHKTPGLKAWAAQYASLFDVVAFFEDKDPEGRQGASNGGRTWLCPNADAHTQNAEAKTGFWIKTNDGEGFTAKCHHSSCVDMDRLDFLDMVCQKVGIEGAHELEDWCAELADPTPATPEVLAAKPTKEITLPKNYENSGGWLCFAQIVDGSKKHTKLCHALEFKGVTHDQNEEDWSLVISFKNQRGKTQDVLVPRANSLSEPGVLCAELAKAGLVIDGDKESKAKLFTCLSRIAVDPGENYQIVAHVTKPGWYGEAFVTPTGDVINSDGGNLALQKRKGHGIKDKAKRGDLEGWKKNIRELFELLDFHAPIIVSASFAGVLVQLLEMDTCGILVVGPSSIGKSLSQKAGASAWATPENKRGLFTSGNLRGPGFEKALEDGNGCCAHIDDMFANSPNQEMISKMIFVAADGESDTRGTSNGSVLDGRSWKTYYINSAEESAKTVIERTTGDILSGHEVRLISIDLTGAKEHTDPDKIMRLRDVDRNLKHNSGWAGEAFVHYLVSQGLHNDPKALEKEIQDASEWLLSHGKRDRLRARAAYSLAVAMIAGEIAQNAGLLPSDFDLSAAFREGWLRSLGNPDELVGNSPEKGLERFKTLALSKWRSHAARVEHWKEPDSGSRGDVWFVHNLTFLPRGPNAGKPVEYVAVSQDALKDLCAPSSLKAVVDLMVEKKMVIMKDLTHSMWEQLGKKDWKHYRLTAECITPPGEDDDFSDDDAGEETTLLQRVEAVEERYRSLGISLPAPRPDPAHGDGALKAYLLFLESVERSTLQR